MAGGTALRRVTIAGTGAMACLFGSRLAQAARVTLTGGWVEGITKLRTSGILVEEPAGSRAVRVDAVPWGAEIAPADLVLILVKTWQTAEVARHLEHLLKPQGVAVTLQNGLRNLEVLGSRARLGVTCQGATLLGPGHVRACGAGPTWMAASEWIVRLFREGGIDAAHGNPQQIDGFLWGKLAVNCGINALTALLRIPNGGLLALPDASC